MSFYSNHIKISAAYERLETVLAFVALSRTGIYNVTALVDNLESSESGNLGEPSKRDGGPAKVETDQLTCTLLYTSSECHLTFTHMLVHPTLPSSDTQVQSLFGTLGHF